MTTALSPATALRIYLTLSATRWLPVGFVLGTFGLLALERGLSVSQVTAYGAAQGIVVLLVELPSSALADVLGRKPVLLVAGVVNIAAISAYLIAHTFWAFAIAAALMGLFRALDSGPLDAWFVDSLHEHSPEADPAPALAKFGTTFSLALAFGAVPVALSSPGTRFAPRAHWSCPYLSAWGSASCTRSWWPSCCARHHGPPAPRPAPFDKRFGPPQPSSSTA